MNIKSQLQQLCGDTEFLRLNDVNIEPEKIRAILINEVVPVDSDDDFYGKSDSAYIVDYNPAVPKGGDRGKWYSGYIEPQHLHHQCRQDTQIGIHSFKG